MPSGPIALELLLFLIALILFSSVISISGSSVFFCRFLRRLRKGLVAFMLVLGVNCWLNLFACFLGTWMCLPLNLMDWLSSLQGFGRVLVESSSSSSRLLLI